MDNRTRDTGYGLLNRWRWGFNRASLAEKQLVLLRLAVSSSLFLALLSPFLGASPLTTTGAALNLAGLYLLFSLSLLVALALAPTAKTLRLNLSLIGDIAILCAGFFLAAVLAVPLLLASLWVTLSYGIRFGIPYLYRASLLSTAGFGLAMLFNAYWSDHLLVGATLLVAILTVPIAAASRLAHQQSAGTGQPQSHKGHPGSAAMLSQETAVPHWGIMGMADMLLHSSLDKEQTELAQCIHSMAQQLEFTYEHSISLDHAPNSELATTESSFNLRQSIDVVLQSLQQRIRRKSLAFSVQVAGDVPSCISGDAIQLRLLLCNLIGNAIYQMENGSKIACTVTITEVKDAFYPQPLLRFEFRAQNSASQLQSHSPAAKEIALYQTPLTQRLLDQLNASVGIGDCSENNPILWLDLPIELSKEQATESNNATLKNIRVLLITSDAALQHKLESHLRGWQVKHTACQSGPQAFAELITAAKQNHPYDAALIDVQHFDMEPAQFAHLSRHEEAICKLSLIALYPADQQNLATAFHEADFSATVQIPLDKTLLFNALHICQEKPTDNQKVTCLIDRYGQSRNTAPTLDILVATDDRNNRMRIRKILERAGHQVYLVENGEQALNALDTHRFDLAILKMQLPVMTGIEAVKLYRFTHLHDNWMTFIMLIADGNPDAIQQCKRADVDRCLAGPLKPEELLEHIRQISTKQMTVQQQSELTNKPPANSPPRVDANHLDQAILGQSTLSELEKLGAGQDFVSNLINNFLQDSDYLLAQMESAYHLHQHQAYIDLAHTFKDSAGNLGALAIYNLSVTATRFSEDEFIAEGGRLVTAIRKAFELTRQALMNYLSRQDDSISRH